MSTTLLLDGGTGSELRRRGITFNESVWSAEANLTEQNVLTGIHRDYIAAGADVITANTFATSRFVLAAGRLADRFETININALTAAREAAATADRPVLIAASLSCCPPFLDMSMRPDPATELRHYQELANLFAGQGVDLILLEMLQHPEHAASACRAAQESGLPFWAGISCREDMHSDSGLSSFDAPAADFNAIVDAILPFAPVGIAIMHSPPAAISLALGKLRRRWSGPVGAYAEIAYDEDPDVKSPRQISPDSYAQLVEEWLDSDLELVGGCCGTTPAHIGALRKLLD